MNLHKTMKLSIRFQIALLALGMNVGLHAQPAIYTYDPAGNPIAVTPGTGGAPLITASPQAELVQSNSLATFSVNATGTGLTYQWLSNGIPIIGANSDTLVLANLALTGTNLGSFSVIVSNANGLSVTSAPAALWADANGNGIPDWWELSYFGNLNQTASGDPDNDGVANFSEYLEGTVPPIPRRSIRGCSSRPRTERFRPRRFNHFIRWARSYP